MSDAILRQRVFGRQVDGHPTNGHPSVLCRLTGLPIESCGECGAHCARCGCSDFAACPGGCEWDFDDEMNDVCSNCVGVPG